MKISRKIAAWKEIVDNDKKEADRIQREAVAAIHGGIKHKDWETYMRNFHSNAEQLNRLLGKAPLMSNYGDEILAYITGGGPCGGGTKLSMAAGISLKLRIILDSGVPSDTKDDGSNPVQLPKEILKLLEEEAK